MAGTVAASLRSLYITLRHAAVPLQIVIEDDCHDVGAGLSAQNISAVYVVPPQVTGAAAEGIAAWVRSAGGRVFSVAGGGLLDERNQSNTVMHGLLGLTTSGLFTGDRDFQNATVWFIKQDLPYAQVLDHVTLADTMPSSSSTTAPIEQRLSVKGAKLICRFDAPTDAISSRVLGRFADDTVAAATIEYPAAGRAVFTAFHVGLSYFDPSIPRRPVDRGSTDQNFNHYLPHTFGSGARQLATVPIDDLAATRPVVPSDPLIEAGMIRGGDDTVLVLVNWRGSPVQNLTLTLGTSVVPALQSMQLSRSSGQPVHVLGQSALSVPTLDVADAVVMRRNSQ
eukprot:SAG22_NODE_464_length_10191_cov_14.495541_3_plen_338_part_00